jgi:hypothetical protein
MKSNPDLTRFPWLGTDHGTTLTERLSAEEHDGKQTFAQRLVPTDHLGVDRVVVFAYRKLQINLRASARWLRLPWPSAGLLPSRPCEFYRPEIPAHVWQSAQRLVRE